MQSQNRVLATLHRQAEQPKCKRQLMRTNDYQKQALFRSRVNAAKLKNIIFVESEERKEEKNSPS